MMKYLHIMNDIYLACIWWHKLYLYGGHRTGYKGRGLEGYGLSTFLKSYFCIYAKVINLSPDKRLSQIN